MGLPDDITNLTWGLHIQPKNLTIAATIARAGLCFTLPVEIPSDSILPYPEAIATGMFLFVTVPLALQRLRKRWDNKKDKSNDDEEEEPEGLDAALEREALKKLQEEEEKNGLRIIKAVYGSADAVSAWEKRIKEDIDTPLQDDLKDVTTPLLYKVQESNLMISGRQPKSSLIGFPRSKKEDTTYRLGIHYRYGTQTITSTFSDDEAVHLP